MEMDLFSQQENRIHELEDKIKYYQDAYYNGEGVISDSEFDKLWDELKDLDPNNSILKAVGSDKTDGFEKVAHIIPMGSQEKAANPESFLSWAVKHDYKNYLVQYKLDGASLELQYKNGKFVKAVTRGDGVIGDDITNNVKKMSGIVLSLPKIDGKENTFSGGVRGEVIMLHSVHEEKYSDKANCRNAANGLMKRKDGSGSENLNVICYDATSIDFESPFLTEKEKIKWLLAMGFETVPMKICNSPEDVIEYRTHVMDIRKSISYDIDGLVIKNDEIDMVDARRARPDKQIAFKFSLEEAVSTLKSVEWSESGATYTPIAIIEPVQLAGTTVQRASLANPNLIKNLNLKIGSRVVVTKRGEIIPKIEYLVENPKNSTDIAQPVKCSTCGTVLVDEGTRLYCPNKNCPKRIHHRLEKWVQVLDIKEFGTLLIQRLFESGLVNSIYDFYKLSEEQLANIDRMGDLSAKKALKNRDAKREIPLATFIAGFDIEGLGEVLLSKLVEAGFTTLESLLNAKNDEIAKIYQFGEITAQTLVDGLQKNRQEMLNLVNEGIIKIKAPITGGGFSGMSFCFTGELNTLKRSQAEAIIQELGGVSKSSVVKGLSYLVTNNPNSGSSKNKKAQELGTKIITEEDFLQLVKSIKTNKEN